MKIQQPKKPETRTKVDFWFERAGILSTKPARKIGPKVKNKQLFETNLDPNWQKIATFSDKVETIHITHPPLAVEIENVSYPVSE